MALESDDVLMTKVYSEDSKSMTCVVCGYTETVGFSSSWEHTVTDCLAGIHSELLKLTGESE